MAVKIEEEQTAAGNGTRTWSIGRGGGLDQTEGLAKFAAFQDRWAAEMRQAHAPKIEDVLAGRLTAWFRDIEAIAPCQSTEIKISVSDPTTGAAVEHVLAIRNPRTGAWMAAFPALHELLQAAKAAAPEGATPADILAVLVNSWDAAQIVEKGGHALLGVLDRFLGKDAGWVEANTEPQHLIEIVAAFLRVIPLDAYKRFFAQGVAAVKGHRATSRPASDKS